MSLLAAACLFALTPCAQLSGQLRGQESTEESVQLDRTASVRPLDELRLPVAEHCVEDDWDVKVPRTVISFHADGNAVLAGAMLFKFDGGIWVTSNFYGSCPLSEMEVFDRDSKPIEITLEYVLKRDAPKPIPLDWSSVDPVAKWMAPMRSVLIWCAERMEQAPDAERPTWLVPVDPLVLRADAMTPFVVVSETLRACGLQMIRIQDVHFAVSPPGEAAPWRSSDAVTHLIPVPLTRSAEVPTTGDFEQSLTLKVRVENAGRRIVDDGSSSPWKPELEASFRYDETRRITYQVGEVTSSDLKEVADTLASIQAQHPTWVVLDVAPDATYGEAIRVLSAMRGAGCTGYRLKAAFFDS